METKTIISNVVTAVITAAALGVFGFFMGIFEKGAEAIGKEQIREVLKEEMKTDAGITYGAALSQIGLDINTVSTQVGILQTDVRALEASVLDLASE